MIVTTCIKENRDLKGRIENYVLADMQGNNIILDSNNIKMNIKMGNLKVSNLKITADGRLIHNKNISR